MRGTNNWTRYFAHQLVSKYNFSSSKKDPQISFVWNEQSLFYTKIFVDLGLTHKRCLIVPTLSSSRS